MGKRIPAENRRVTAQNVQGIPLNAPANIALTLNKYLSDIGRDRNGGNINQHEGFRVAALHDTGQERRPGQTPFLSASLETPGNEIIAHAKPKLNDVIAERGGEDTAAL